jgi:hypothetical protein
MAYIGKSIESGTFSVLDTSGNTYNGSNTTFNLGTQVGSTAQLLVSHDGVIQKPGTDYTLASGGTQITFTTAPASGASIFIVEISGAVGGPLDSDLNGSELILDADGDTSITADTDDQIDFKIAGADDLRMTANNINVLSGTTLTIDSGATITNSGTANGFGALAGIDDQSSSNDDQLTITDTAVVINEDSDDVDFRVEGNGVASLLHVNAGDDRVGIGGDPDLGTAGGLHIKINDSGASADGNADELVIENGANAGDAGINILSATNGTGRVSFGDSGDNDVGFMRYDHSNGRMWIINNGGDTTYAHAFDSNVTTTTNFRLQIFSDGAENQRHRMIGFDNSSQGRGYIESGDGDSTAPQFAAGSDRRLKENITTYTGGYDKIKAIPVKQWDEKYSSKNKGVKGWVADELETVFPDAVSGTANATKNVTNAILDKDGRLVEENTTEARLTKMQSIGKMPNCTFASSATVPVYQYSSPLRFFPDVVQALQKSIEKIEALEARVTTLEG